MRWVAAALRMQSSTLSRWGQRREFGGRPRLCCRFRPRPNSRVTSRRIASGSVLGWMQPPGRAELLTNGVFCQKWRLRVTASCGFGPRNPALLTGRNVKSAASGAIFASQSRALRAFSDLAAGDTTVGSRPSIRGHRRIFPKSYAKPLRGTLSVDFVGAGRPVGAALWAKCSRH
jgi:hypothetical protein